MNNVVHYVLCPGCRLRDRAGPFPDTDPGPAARPRRQPPRAPHPSSQDRDVHRLPRHQGLPGELSRGLQGSDDFRPERQVHRRRAHGLQERRPQAPDHARHRRQPVRAGHQRHRRLLRGARQGRRQGRWPTSPRRSRTRRSRACCRRRPASPAMVPTSPSRSTRAIPRSPASMPTTCSSRSRPTRPTTTPASAAPTASWAPSPSSSATPN